MRWMVEALGCGVLSYSVAVSGRCLWWVISLVWVSFWYGFPLGMGFLLVWFSFWYGFLSGMVSF
jgi:hypothetical protein